MAGYTVVDVVKKLAGRASLAVDPTIGSLFALKSPSRYRFYRDVVVESILERDHVVSRSPLARRQNFRENYLSVMRRRIKWQATEESRRRTEGYAFGDVFVRRDCLMFLKSFLKFIRSVARERNGSRRTKDKA